MTARLTTEEFIEKAVTIHGDKYGYKNVKYIAASTKVSITCFPHGDFLQTPHSHKHGRRCPKCAVVNPFNRESFIENAKAVHGDLYIYDAVKYVNSQTKVELRCKKHGVFKQKPNGHITGNGCVYCGAEFGPSKEEIEMSEFVSSLVEIKVSDRTVIAPQEIDCLIPSKKVGIEFCGVFFHSEKFKTNSYHLDKTKAANAAGYELVHIFDDEWMNSKPIVKSILRNKLGLSETVIYARKTEIRELSARDLRDFLTVNHLQGNANAEVKLGLYLGNELVFVAAFSKSRKVLGEMPEAWYELVRLCPKLNTVVVGGFSKLLKHFISAYSPAGIKTFCDKRYFNGKGYEAVGFVKVRDSIPNYFYIKRRNRYSRFMFQKHKLANKLAKFDPLLTEKENMRNNGYLRIYDCGNAVFQMDLT